MVKFNGHSIAIMMERRLEIRKLQVKIADRLVWKGQIVLHFHGLMMEVAI